MKSFRVWFSSIALGAVLAFSAPSLQAQVPEGFTYQGVLVDNGVPLNGAVTLTISLSEKSGNVLFSETFANVIMTNGIFDIVIGGSFPFPLSLTFNEQYFLTVVAATSNGTTTLAPTELWSAPYAINSGTVNGIAADSIPVAGELFPVPLSGQSYTGTAKMNASFLPIIPNVLLQTPDIVKINGVGPDQNSNFEINGGTGIIVTPGTNEITISSSVQNAITGVLAGPGLTTESTGNAGVVEIGIADGGVTSSMLASQLSIGSSSSTSTALTAVSEEANGNEALLIKGGIGADNVTGLVDGSGLSSASPQTFWADKLAVPVTTGTSLQIFNTLVTGTSTIVITPFESSASANQLVITAQNAGTFTVGSTSSMGNGAVLVISYLVINH